MMSRRPPNAPTGNPPPMILPSVVMSGVMLKWPCAPRGPTRKPVITSSNINTAPCLVHSLRSVCRKFLVGNDQIHIAGDRLDDHAGDLIAHFRERIFDLLRVVVVLHERVRRRLPAARLPNLGCRKSTRRNPLSPTTHRRGRGNNLQI